MADIVKSGTPSVATVGPDSGSCKHPTLICGEAIGAGDACYVKSDGKIWRSNGAAVAAAAKVRGFAATPANAGDALTLMFHVVYNYGSGLTPGADFYLSGVTPGGLADAASTGGTAPIAFAIDTTRVYVKASGY